LFLDLDETLVHACENLKSDRSEKHHSARRDSTINIFKVRPYAISFLKSMATLFEVYIFTAASIDYANSIIKVLDPNRDIIAGILDRSCCHESKTGALVKDLRIVSNREMNKMVIVDNLVHSFAFQLDNGISVLEWRGEPEDTELVYLEKYLKLLAKCENIPQYNRKMLRLVEFGDVSLENCIDV